MIYSALSASRESEGSLLPGFVTSGLTSFRIDYLLMYAEHFSPIHVEFAEIRDVRDLAHLFELAVCITAEAELGELIRPMYSSGRFVLLPATARLSECPSSGRRLGIEPNTPLPNRTAMCRK